MVAITTDEYWDVDGVPLNTYAYNISSLTGRLGSPGTSGDDQEQAYRPGVEFRPKVPASRTLQLGMWVQGSDPDQVGTVTDDPSARFHTNFRKLQRLFFTPRRQFVLTKRWRDLEGSHMASALGQVTTPISPAVSKNRLTMVVDVFLADPFFYDTTTRTASVSPGGSVVVDNPGDTDSPRHLTVTFHGPLTNPILKNTTPNPDISMSYTGTIAAGQSLVVEVMSSRAVLAGSLVNTALSFTGSIWPMEIFRGENTLSLFATGSGHATVSYRPAYF